MCIEHERHRFSAEALFSSLASICVHVFGCSVNLYLWSIRGGNSWYSVWFSFDRILLSRTINDTLTQPCDDLLARTAAGGVGASPLAATVVRSEWSAFIRISCVVVFRRCFLYVDRSTQEVTLHCFTPVGLSRFYQLIICPCASCLLMFPVYLFTLTYITSIYCFSTGKRRKFDNAFISV